MRRLGQWVWLGLFIFAIRAETFGANNSLVMEMIGAPGKVNQQKIEESVRWAVEELHLAGQPLPVIAVFHIPASAAEQLGIGGTSLWRNRGDSKRYEFWIVGEPSNSIYSQMAVGILEPHFALKLDGAERARVIKAVCTRLDSTISAKALLPPPRWWK
jgi:hypothetical protein